MFFLTGYNCFIKQKDYKMYVIENPVHELIMLNKHGVIELSRIKSKNFKKLFEIKKVSQSTMIDYEVLCITCEQNLKIYEEESDSIREANKDEMKDFVIKS